MATLQNFFLEMFKEPQGKRVYMAGEKASKTDNGAQEYQEIKDDIKEKKDQKLLTDREYAEITKRLEELNATDSRFTPKEQKEIKEMEKRYVGEILDLQEKNLVVPKTEVVTITEGQLFYPFLKDHQTTLKDLIKLNKGDNDIHGNKFYGYTEDKHIPYFIKGAEIMVPAYGTEVIRTTLRRTATETDTDNMARIREDISLTAESDEDKAILSKITERPDTALLNKESFVPDELWQRQTVEAGTETDKVKFNADENEWSKYMLSMQGGPEFSKTWTELIQVFSSYDKTKKEALGELKQEEKQLESSKLKKERTPGSHNPKYTGPKYRWVPKEVPKDITEEDLEKINTRLTEIQKEKAKVELLYPEEKMEGKSPTTLFIECLKKGRNQKLTFDDISKTVIGMKGEDVTAEYARLKSKGDKATDDEKTRMTQLQQLMVYSYKILRQLSDLSTKQIQVNEDDAPRLKVEHKDERTDDQKRYDAFLESQINIIFEKTDLGPKMKLRLMDVLKLSLKRDVLNMELLERGTPGKDRGFSEAHAYKMVLANSGDYAKEGQFVLNPDFVLRTLNTLIVQGIQGGRIDDELLAKMDYSGDREVLAKALQMYIDAPGNTRVEKTDYVFKNVINPEVMLATIQDPKLQELLKKYRESTGWTDWKTKWSVIVQYSKGKQCEEEVTKASNKAILFGNALNGANIDKFLLSPDFVDINKRGTATDLQISLIERGFDYKTGAIDSGKDKVETTRAAMAFCKEHYSETYPILEAIINEAKASGKDFSAEEMIKTGESVQGHFLGAVGVLFDKKSIYREVPNENGKGGTHLEFDKSTLKNLWTAQGVLELPKGLYLHGGLTAGQPDVGAGATIPIGDAGAYLGFRVSWSPTTPGKETSASLGATIPLGKSPWSIFGGATLALDDKGVFLPPPTLALAAHKDLGKAAQQKYEKFQKEHAAEIDKAIATATSSLEGITLSEAEKKVIKDEIYSYFAADMTEEALQEAVGGPHLTGAGLALRVPLPDRVPPITLTPLVLKFSIGGRTIIKRVRKDSEKGLSLLSEARIEQAIRENVGGESVFGDSLIKAGAEIGKPSNLSIDSETGQYELESYDSRLLNIDPMLPLKTYDQEMNKIGIDLDQSADGKMINMEVKNTKDNLVRVVIDPKMKANLIADPTGMHLSLNPTEIPGLVIRREDFHYPFAQGGAITHTIITITDNPELKRSTIEREMSPTGLRYLQYIDNGTGVKLYDGRRGERKDDNLFFFDKPVTQEDLTNHPKLKEAWDEATKYDLTSGLDPATIRDKVQAAIELKRVVSAESSEPISDKRNTELRGFAQELIDHEHFRRKDLTDKSPEVLNTTIQDAAERKFGNKLKDREYNCVLGHATALSFRQLEVSSRGNEKTAKDILQAEIRSFASPTLTKRLRAVASEADAKVLAQEFLQRTYALDANGRPTINLLSQETFDLPAGASREVLAGLDRAAGTRGALGEGKLLNQSIQKYDIRSENPEDRSLAKAILALRSPVPEADKELSRCPLALQITPSLHRFFTAEHVREITGIYKNPDSADYSSDTFQNFKALIVAMRSAELDGIPLLVQAEDGPEFAIEFGIQTFAGLEMPCRNETLALVEGLVVRQAVRTGGVDTKTVAHVGTEASKNYYEFGFGVGIRNKNLTIPRKETPPEETPPPHKFVDSGVINKGNLQTWGDNTDATGSTGNPGDQTP